MSSSNLSHMKKLSLFFLLCSCVLPNHCPEATGEGTTGLRASTTRQANSAGYYPKWHERHCVADGQQPISQKLTTLAECCKKFLGETRAACLGEDIVSEKIRKEATNEDPLEAKEKSDYFIASSNPFEGIVNTTDIPQFVLLTVDDSVTFEAVRTFSAIGNFLDVHGCAVKATWYISIGSTRGSVLTKCKAVQLLRQAQHEIATHTVSHIGKPSVEEIEGAVTWLNKCGIPLEEIRGFRTPYLDFTQETFNRLHDLGFLYDSSISELSSSANGGRDFIWPYTMDEGIAQNCAATAGSCDKTKSNPGLWEVPMWALYDASENILPIMDYPGNAYDNLSRNLERRYNGNRAPLGVFMHYGWLATHIDEVKQWVREVLQNYDDVFFVTNYELIEYLRNPVPKQDYERNCGGPVLRIDCTPPAIGCAFGKYDSEACSCICTPPYIKDSNGVCRNVATPVSPADPVDGGWSEWSSYGPCRDGIQTRTRTCTSPRPANGGTDCKGVSSEQQDCKEAAYEVKCNPTTSGCLHGTFNPDACSCNCTPPYIKDTNGVCTNAATLASPADPVDGGWSEWSSYGPCRDGIQTRTRTCTSPRPANGGTDCEGESSEQPVCQEAVDDSKPNRSMSSSRLGFPTWVALSYYAIFNNFFGPYLL